MSLFEGGALDAVKMLSANHVDPNLQDSKGETALQLGDQEAEQMDARATNSRPGRPTIGEISRDFSGFLATSRDGLVDDDARNGFWRRRRAVLRGRWRMGCCR